MCAIAGWQHTGGNGGDLSVLRMMLQSMAHRGPDDSGEYHDGSAGIAFAHRRLSIIDLSDASHQPMVDAATGVAMIYNGELYNFAELRAALVARGHEFRSSGDAEVVLRSFIEWGTGAFGAMAGMFALAIWDPRDRTLHLARDAMGMKPLYYSVMPEGFLFASEVKAFHAVPGLAGRVDPIALRQYLEFGYVFENDRTMLAGIHKLGPGERLEVREGKVVVHETWFHPPAPDKADGRTEAERVAELRSTLQQVVAQHLVADVPLGMLLSGGLDSSVIAAIAAQRGPLLTITMGFGSSSIDERGQAREVSAAIGSRHQEILITPAEVRAEVSQGAWVFDDLFADWGTLTTRLLYRRCRESGIKVVLVGEGADELFGGYDIFELPARLGLWQQFRLYQKYSGRRHGRLFGAFRRAMGDYLASSGGDTFDAVRLFESRRQLPNQYVMKVDKASMAESVEARAPYLDRRVAELAYRTPREWLLRGGQNKYLLRAVAASDAALPAAVASRRKFGAPLPASWMDEDAGFRAFARERLLDSGSQTRKLGLESAMRAYYDEGREGFAFPAGLSLFRNLAWRLLLLELWSAQYLRPAAAA